MAGGGRNRERQNYWDSQSQQQNQQITQVDPAEQAIRDQNMAFLNWQKSDGRDVRDAPGMSEYIQIGQGAKERANRERFGTGALQLGADGAQGHAAKLKELRQAEDGQNFGVGLENALAMRNAEVKGSVLPLAQLQTNRRVAQAGHSAGMFSQWNQRKSKNWWDYLTDTVGMATSFFG